MFIPHSLLSPLAPHPSIVSGRYSKMASAFVPFFIFYLEYFILSSKKYDNASDEINYRILTLIQNAEKVYNSGVYNVIGRFQILCELPHNGDAVLVNQKDEVYGIRDTVISNR